MKLALVFAAAGAAALVAGSAEAAPTTQPSQARAARSCFWTRDVSGYSVVDPQTVNIRVGVGDVYQLKLMGPTLDLSSAWRIGIASRGSDSICSPLDATVVVPGPIGPQRMPVTAMRKLSPQEIAALPRSARP